MLGFDYFKLLDLLTIARSRKHIEKYYGTTETGRFPERLKPINIKREVDLTGEFSSIREINNEIRRLTLAAYAPLRYVLPHRQAAYDAKYSTKIRGGESFFRQVDREESLVHLLRVNVLKRMESSVTSFYLTVHRQLADVEATLAKIETQAEALEEIDIADVDAEDPAFESLLVGRKVKVLLQDVDRIKWRQDLIEDRNRLATLLSAAKQVNAARDAKLQALREVIEQKCRAPLNPGNRKLLVFTAFADTAQYLYRELAKWALKEFGLHAALVTGTGQNQTTLPNLRKDFVSIITAFSPRSKERPEDLAADGEIDLLIATDCVSEGQNLQDCDTVVNYDIHWNPVRIIQRFGRIDRLGSINERIQLINFWPNLELEEYINLEQRVSGRMVLLDISATGEENIIEYQSGDQMNDLEYRRNQLLKLQEAVIDLEDLSSGVSIADLTLNDFRVDLAGFLKEHPEKLERLPFGTFAVTTTQAVGEATIPPGVIFCLRAVGEAALKTIEPGYPLAPHYVVHVGDDGAVLLPFTQVKQLLDRLKRLSIGRDLPDAGACDGFDKATRNGKDMRAVQDLLATAVASVVGKKEERAIASLFTPGGTHAMKGEFQGINDFEVVAFLVVLPESPGGGRRMNFATVIDALGIPPQALVEQRVPKRMLVEHGAPTPADKRQIQDGIEEIVWVAALKPTNIGVPSFQDVVRQYLEIAVVTVALHSTAKPQRLIELIHRAIPYPLVLVAGHGENVTLSLAHKRLSQGETGKVVVEDVRQVALSPDVAPTQQAAFLVSLAVSRLSSRNLFTLYDGMLARLTALEASRITGAFAPPDSEEASIALREGLDRHTQLRRDLDLLRTRAAKEKQINRRVELNLELKRLEAELAAANCALKEEG